MKTFSSAILITALCCSLGLPGSTATAAPAEPRPALMLAAQNTVTAKQAAKRAQQQHGGRVLSVQLKNSDMDNAYYAVKLIKNGKVRIVKVPAR